MEKKTPTVLPTKDDKFMDDFDDYLKTLNTDTPIIYTPKPQTIIPTPTILKSLPTKNDMNLEKVTEYVNDPNIIEDLNSTRPIQPYSNNTPEFDSIRVQTIIYKIENQIYQRMLPQYLKNVTGLEIGDLSMIQWDLLKSRLEPWIIKSEKKAKK